MSLGILLLTTALGFLLIRTPAGPVILWGATAFGIGYAHREGWI